MKKIKFVLLLVACASLVSSCKTREKCPAYGKAQPVKTTRLPS